MSTRIHKTLPDWALEAIRADWPERTPEQWEQWEQWEPTSVRAMARTLDDTFDFMAGAEHNRDHILAAAYYLLIRDMIQQAAQWDEL